MIPDQAIEARILEMMKEDPMKLMQYFIIVLGRETVKTNATDLTLFCEADIEDNRYKITTKITVEPV